MKEKINKIKEYYKNHPKRFWAIGAIVLIVLFYMFTHQAKSTITFVTANKVDLKQTILATGQVTSKTDISLSFPVSGVIESLPVSVGDKVYKGQVVAMLSNRSQYAALSNAKANYQKVVDGTSNEEVAVAQAAVDSAKANLDSTQKVQDTLLENAHRTLYSADLTPTLTSGISNVTPLITGTYTGTESGSYTVIVYFNGTGGYFTWSGLETGSNTISQNSASALGTNGLFIQFPANFPANTNTIWTVNLPNLKSDKYLVAYNAYQNALKNHDSAISAATASLNEAKANLALKKAEAQPADVAVASAKVDQAQADYQNTILYAPANGTIAHVNTKVGESVDPKTEMIVLQDVDNLYVEANVNETSIAKIALDQPVSMTLDAFGPETTFTGNVVHIDPSSTTKDGVVNYVIKTTIVDPNGINKVRPGMNSNMIITAWTHVGVIAIPKIAVITKDDGKYVNVVTDDKKGKYEARKITTGLVGDGNLIEITSGLNGGEEIAINS
jgi:RND family efflux transporter MFP subunit